MNNIKKITAAELKTLPLNDLVAICKALDNGNGEWSNVTADEYSDILQTATNFITDYQS